MDEKTAAALRYWKTHRYVEDQIPFVEAVSSLSTKKPLLEIKQSTVRDTEWLVCHVGSSNPAVMTYAGIFAEAEPYETGNLVWGDNAPDPSLEDGRIVTFAGFKATYSYAIETYDDQEIWDLQRRLDGHVANVRGFNAKGLPRLEWQNGKRESLRFYMRTPMFIPFQSRSVHPPPPTNLHPWVQAAHNKSRSYRANPKRPRVRAIEDGQLRYINECDTKKLEYGDVVGLTFTVVYVVNEKNWSPVYYLRDIIRVMAANRAAYPLQAPVEEDDDADDDGDFSITETPASKVRCQQDGDGNTTCLGDGPEVPKASQVAGSTSGPTVDHTRLIVSSTSPTGTSVPTLHSRVSESPPPYAPVVSPDMEVDDDDTASTATEATRASPSVVEHVQGAHSATAVESTDPEESSSIKRNARSRTEEYVEDDRVGTGSAGPAAKGRKLQRAKGKQY